MKDYIFKILLLIIIAAAGLLLVPLTINLMIWADILNSESVSPEFLQTTLQKSVFVWLGAVLIGITSLFITQSWRIALLLCPLLLPSLFMLIYTITQS